MLTECVALCSSPTIFLAFYITFKNVGGNNTIHIYQCIDTFGDELCWLLTSLFAEWKPLNTVVNKNKILHLNYDLLYMEVGGFFSKLEAFTQLWASPSFVPARERSIMQNDTCEIWTLNLKPSIFCVIYFCSISCHLPSLEPLSLNKNLPNKSLASWVMVSLCACICTVQKQSSSSSDQFIQSIRPLFNTRRVRWPLWCRGLGVNGRQLRHLTSSFPEFNAGSLIPPHQELSWYCPRTICPSWRTHIFHSRYFPFGFSWDWSLIDILYSVFFCEN